VSGQLSREETVALVNRAQTGDDAACETLVEANIALVKSIVRRFLGRGCEYDDLLQLGSMGLYKAIMGFDPSMDTQLSTYAVPFIMGEIRRFLRDNGAIKVSRSVKQLGIRAQAVLNRIRLESEKEPTIDQLASVLEVSADELLMALDALRPVRSLDAPVEGGEQGLLYTMVEGAGDGTKTFEIRDMIERLDERERVVIVMRYFRGITQGEIAGMLSLSQAQVSRIEAKALKQLREAM